MMNMKTTKMMLERGPKNTCKSGKMKRFSHQKVLYIYNQSFTIYITFAGK